MPQNHLHFTFLSTCTSWLELTHRLLSPPGRGRFFAFQVLNGHCFMRPSIWKKIQLEFLARHTKDLPKYIPLSVFNQIVTNNSLNLALEQRLLGSNVQSTPSQYLTWHMSPLKVNKNENSLLLLHTISHVFGMFLYDCPCRCHTCGYYCEFPVSCAPAKGVAMVQE